MKISRRHFLQWGTAGAAAPVVGALAPLGLLAGCGSSDSAVAADTAKPVWSNLAFVGMAAPTATADRATTSTSASYTLSNAQQSDVATRLGYQTLYKTGTRLSRPDGGTAVMGGYYDVNGNPILDLSGTSPVQYVSDCPDGTSLIKLPSTTVAGVSGQVLFHVAQFEYLTANAKQGEARPGGGVYNVGGGSNGMYGLLASQIGVTTVSQDPKTGSLTPVYYFPVDTSKAHGLWITCASSLSPWNTHLSSEEYPPDAAGLSGSALAGFQTFSAGGQTGAWRSIFENVLKDFKYVADTSYTVAVTTANGATVYLKPADATAIDYTSYKLINFGSAQQLVKVKAGAEVGAAFLETERYASYLGAIILDAAVEQQKERVFGGSVQGVAP